MGGHGALTIGLKNPGAYKSLSAFSPICNPSEVPWGIKAFSGYLGEDREAWKQVRAAGFRRSGLPCEGGEGGSHAVKTGD